MNAVDVVLASSVPKHANVVGTRIVLSIKAFNTAEERWKARIVVQGCIKRESKTIVSDAGCVTSMSVRILLILGFSLGYRIWTRDVKQAYLQGGKLTRTIYARPPKEMRERLRGYLMWILIPVYGLREAGSYWCAHYMSLFIINLAKKITLVEKYFLYCHPSRNRSRVLVAEHETQIEGAASSLKRTLRLSLGRHSSSRPDGLAAVLLEDTLFAGTSSFRRDE